MKNQGTKRYCPMCGKVVLTHVMDGYAQIECKGVVIKRRKIIHPLNNNGIEGCGASWYTYEIPKDIVDRYVPSQ
jgi:hypothetical protein